MRIDAKEPKDSEAAVEVARVVRHRYVMIELKPI